MIDELSSAKLVEALCNDQRIRWHEGQRTPAESYLEQHPSLESDPQCIVELVYNEILLREELGEEPQLEEYTKRFPLLVTQIARLFQVHRAIESVQPIDSATVDTPRTSTPGTAGIARIERPTIAGYEIIAELGRGGMGVVYRSRQIRLNRPVAMKMILAGQFASAAEVDRFRLEAEAIANLDHPHIVPIYEVGEHAGQHYFSMKLIEGGSLADHMARFADQPRRAATLLATVARAVHYAHQRGLLHRDLKPSNILLDADGQPHVTDFGLAKQVSQANGSATTQSGAIVGTPGYMAPEQAHGKNREISTASDIYSLGAMLYELLTGRPPFRADTSLATLQQMLEGPPARPRVLNPCVDRDLETICLKCLETEPRQRYRSAESLAEDLGHWLAGEPIEARPVGRLERFWRWCRRKPGLAGAAVALLTILGCGVTAVAWQWRRAEKERDRAEKAGDRAEKNFHQARQAIDDFSALVGEHPLINAPGMQPVREKMLREVLKYYQAFLEQHSDDPTLHAALAHAHFRVGQITDSIGSKAEAASEFELARNAYEQLARENPAAPDHQHHVAKCHSALGSLKDKTGQPDDALGCYHKALEILERLVEENPTAKEYQYTLGKIHGYIGNLQDQAGESDEASRSHQRSIAILEELVRCNPEVGEFRYCLAGTYYNVGQLESRTAESARALQSYQQACELLGQLAAENYSLMQVQKDLAFTYNTIGLLHQAGGRPGEAKRSFDQARQIVEKLARESPAVTSFQRDLAATYLNLVGLESTTDNLAETFELAERARQTLERLVRDHATVTTFQNDLARCYRHISDLHVKNEDLAEAVSAAQRAITLQRSLLERVPQLTRYRRDLNVLYIHLANLQRQLSRPSEAAATTLERSQLWPDQPDELYGAARELALCIPLIRKDQSTLTAEDELQRQQYVDQAVKCLWQAFAHGFRDMEQLERGLDLEPLRPYADYQKFVDEVKHQLGAEKVN